MYSEKTCPNAALSTTNPTCCPDANPGRRGGKPPINRLSYGMAELGPYFSSNLVQVVPFHMFHRHPYRILLYISCVTGFRKFDFLYL
jgi:hypothetical protein